MIKNMFRLRAASSQWALRSCSSASTRSAGTKRRANLGSLWNLRVERLRMPGVEVLAGPALPGEPLLEARPGDLRIVAPEGANVGLEAGFVEPLEHLVELLAEDHPSHEKRQSPELDRPSHHAAERRRDLRVGQLVAGDLDGLADEPVRLREGQPRESADVV